MKVTNYPNSRARPSYFFSENCRTNDVHMPQVLMEHRVHKDTPTWSTILNPAEPRNSPSIVILDPNSPEQTFSPDF